MIRISATMAKAEHLRFQALNGTVTMFFGPFVNDDAPPDDVLRYRHHDDTLDERSGIFGENHVNNRQLSANLNIGPLAGLFREQDSIKLWRRATDGSYSNSRIATKDSFYDPVLDGTSVFQRLDSHTILIADITTGRYDINKIRSTGIRVYVRKIDATPQTDGKYYQRTKTVYKSIRIETDQTDFGLARLDIFNTVARTLSSFELPTEFSSPVATISHYLRDKIPPMPYDAMSRVISSLNSTLDQDYDFPDDIKSPGDLVTEAVDTLDSNSINMLEFAQGLKNPKQLIPQLKNLSQLKTHASNYLGLQYAILPGVSDLQTLWDIIADRADVYLDKNNYQVLTAGHSVSKANALGSVTLVNRVKIAVDQTDQRMSSISERLRDIGAFPSINHLWDLVPFSFVIDWFVNIGDMLESIDMRSRLMQLPIKYCTTSSRIEIKPTMPEQLRDLGVTGDITIVYYSRNVSRKAPSPTLNFEVSNSLPSHWLEAGALLLVTRK